VDTCAHHGAAGADARKRLGHERANRREDDRCVERPRRRLRGRPGPDRAQAQRELLGRRVAGRGERIHLTRLVDGDLRDDVLTCAEITRRCGLDMLVLDQTRPDIGLSVAKVVIPGLRHFWLRLAPGRLYDVPVKLGWRDHPCREDELNPIPIFV